MLKKYFLPRACVACLVFVILLSSCASSPSSLLHWNNEALAFTGSYEENGVLFTARFVLGAASEGERTATVTLLSPPACEGMTYTLGAAGYSVEREGESYILSLCPAPLKRLLLLLPEEAALYDVKVSGETRTETVLAKDGTYTFVYREGSERPERVSRDDGVSHLSLTVTSWE